ncbi:MAG: hypothetical protein MHPDNHAH_00148 [Anaerolineales bacterium]|nr:hypothetical protein [Anaerolineales bacterium]
MKILIVGAGVIGVIYGWALTEAGVDVTHFVRKGKKDKFKDGVTLDLLDERKGHPKNNVVKYAPRCVEEISPADGYEFIIVPTNSYQTEAVIKTLAPVSGNALFFIFAANWEGAGFIDRLLPRDRYLMGYPDGGGTIRDGAYWTNLGGEVHLGEVDGEPSGKLEMVKALFARADIQPDVQENILHWLWLHNAMSIGIWAGFAKYREVKPFLKDADLLRECYASTKELLELCARRGVDLKKYPETGTFNLPVWVFIPLFRLLYTYNKSMQRFTAHAADSLQEARENLASIMQTADELHFDLPHTKALGAYLR